MYKYLAPEPRFSSMGRNPVELACFSRDFPAKIFGNARGLDEGTRAGISALGLPLSQVVFACSGRVSFAVEAPFGFVRGLAGQCLAGPCAFRPEPKGLGSPSEERAINT